MSHRKPAHPGTWSGRLEPPIEAICPQRDSPIGIVYYIGFETVRSSLLTTDELRNPATWYLLPRIRAGFSALTVFSAWSVLGTIEAIALFLIFQNGGGELLAIAAMVELAVLPVLVGAWTATATEGTLRSILQKVSLDELATTRLEPRQVLTSFAAPPLMLQAGAMMFSSFLLLLLLASYCIGDWLVYGNDPMGFRGALMLVYLLVRREVLRNFMGLGWGIGVLNSLRRRGKGKALGAALLSIAFPYGTICGLLAMSLIVVIQTVDLQQHIRASIAYALVACISYTVVSAFASKGGVDAFKSIAGRADDWWDGLD